MAQQALEVLHVVAQLQLPSTASGQALLPLPRAHRQLSSPRCLPHLAQVPLRHCLSCWLGLWGCTCLGGACRGSANVRGLPEMPAECGSPLLP